MKLYNQAEEAAEEILRAFKNPSKLPRPLAQVFIHRNDGAPCRDWSWRNQLLVALHGYAQARGFRQWEQVGRKIRRGEKAFRILTPLTRKVVEEESEEERSFLYGFRGVPVFGVEQTEGEELTTSGSDVEHWLAYLPLREVAESWGLTVGAYNGKGARFLGMYRHATGIALGVRNLSTWCHELVHAADDRNGSLKGKKVNREVVAELGGAVLLRLLGYEEEADLGGCWEYIKQQAGESTDKTLAVCNSLLERTCEAIALILDTAEQLQAANESSASFKSSMTCGDDEGDTNNSRRRAEQ